jgi:hypothetical protein
MNLGVLQTFPQPYVAGKLDKEKLSRASSLHEPEIWGFVHDFFRNAYPSLKVNGNF